MSSGGSDVASKQARLGQVLADYMLRVDRGEPVDREQFVAAHAEVADDLTTYFADSDALASIGDIGFPATGGGVAGAPPPVREFGDYELVEVVGQGGMGTVYKAWQRSLKRFVAVKLIRAGQFASQRDVERFVREAEIAASLRHRNIVAIHEAGEYEGQPFFSMPYIEGESLAKILRAEDHGPARPLTPDRAVDYLIEIAKAVRHAHESGVLHRDIKPSNVMIIDANDCPHVTDFGLAKRIEGGSALSDPGTITGTASYMPPEQAVSDRGKVGPASDVYSLGATLYDMLIGHPPFEGATKIDTLRKVLESEPVSPRAINPSVERDLETICLKCLEKEPADRYASVDELIDRLERFRRGETIADRRRSPVERFGRWCKLNPMIAVLGLGVLLLLLVVATVSTAAAISIASARDEAERSAQDEADARAQLATSLKAEQSHRRAAEENQRRAEFAENQALESAAIAQRETATAQQLTEFLLGLFRSSDPIGMVGSPVAGATNPDALSTRDILDLGREKILMDLVDQPLLQSRLLATMGDVYRSLGAFDQADFLITEALERWPSDVDQASRSQLKFFKGWLQHDQGHLDEAERLYREALAVRTAEFGANDLRTTEVNFNLAWLLTERQNYLPASAVDYSEAEQRFRDVLNVRREALGDGHRDVAVAMTGLLAVLLSSGRDDEAMQLAPKALSIYIQQEGGDRLGKAIIDFQTGVVARKRGELKVAIQKYEEALQVLRKVLGQKHPAVALVLGEMAGLLKEAKEFERAEVAIREALAIARQLTGKGHPQMIQALSELAEWRVKQFDYAEAEALYREAIQINRSFPEHVRVVEHRELGNVLVLKGNFEEAAQTLREALGLAVRLDGGADFHTAEARATLARALRETGNFEQSHEEFSKARALLEQLPHSRYADDMALARLRGMVLMGIGAVRHDRDAADIGSRELAERAVAILREIEPSVPVPLGEALLELGRICLGQDDVEPAHAYLEEAHGILSRQRPRGHWQAAVCESLLGSCLVKLDDIEKGELLLVESAEQLEADLGQGHWRTRKAVARVALFYEQSERPENANSRDGNSPVE